MKWLPYEIIRTKRDGHALSEEQIRDLILSYSSGDIPDYQMSSWLMSVFFQGMTEKETLWLTRAMMDSGEIVDLSSIKEFKVDKHSTGGVGDKTSLILGPIVAAAGIPVPMISGRGLGHTGGTLDKLESMPGFNTQLDLDHFKKYVKSNKICFIGQTKEICPADKKLYALRDVTATVDCIPLICASIMSKKLAEGIDGLVLDVKYGSGAFMKSSKDARQLSNRLVSIARGYGKKCSSFITNMNQPLGRFSGNSLEVKECLDIMSGKTCLNDQGFDLYSDTKELSLVLSSEMMFLSGLYKNRALARKHAEQILDTGLALKKFKELCGLHGGDWSKLPEPKNSFVITSKVKGWVTGFDVEKIGLAGIKINAGRRIKEDTIEPTAGFEFHKKIGHAVKIGDPIFTIYGSNPKLFSNIIEDLNTSIFIKKIRPKNTPSLIYENDLEKIPKK